VSGPPYLKLGKAMTKLGVVNFGMGNISSITNVLHYYKIPYDLINYTEKNFDKHYDGYILPGVGSFKNAMDTINSSGLGKYIIQEVKEKHAPILGVCLGMQLLFDSSTEGGGARGLGLIEGDVQSFESSILRVPHVGWNQISILKKNLLTDLDNNDYYFDHSFYVSTHEDNIISTTDYLHNFPSIVNKGRIYGVQFHPEKSQLYGTKIINNFAKLCGGGNA